METLVGEQGRKILEEDLALGIFRLVVVYLGNLQQREVTLAVLGGTDLAGNGVAGAQAETTNLTGGDIDVIRSCQVGAIRGTQKTETILKNRDIPSIFISFASSASSGTGIFFSSVRFIMVRSIVKNS
jgi:hypothetical protein